VVNLNLAKWNRKNVIDWDVISYYSYLPAYFIEGDISLKFYEKNPDYYSYQNHMYVPLKCPNGNLVIKTTMGMAMMYLPFFSVAHAYAKLSGYDTNGFSEPYQCLIQFSGLFYLLVGLFFLRKILLQNFNEKVTAFTLLSLVFGTHLVFYGSVHGAMAHATDFMLAAMFIYYSVKWLQVPRLKFVLLLGVVGGLLVLIRPVNILIFSFLLLYKIDSVNSLTERFKLFISNVGQLLIMVVIIFLVVLPQLMYWKFITGQYLFNSYVGESFYFAQPHLLDGLFGFRKGWLLYAPIMIFSLIGVIWMFRKKKEFALAVSVLFLVYTYVILSWWCWWYGGSWGLRAMIDIYPFLALGMAVYINRLYNEKVSFRKAGFSILIALIVLNLFQTLQYRWGIIHYDGMTKEAYTDALFRIEKSPDLEKLIKRPDYDKALKGVE